MTVARNLSILADGANTSGTLGIAYGGTNSTATATAGAVVYANGSAHAITAAGTTGQILVSGGTGTPTFTSTPTVSSMNSGQLAGFRNRIINGAMTIDQRNNGASSTAIAVYMVDRYNFQASQTGKLTWGQNLNSVTPPTGFSSYLGFQSTSAYTVGSSDYFQFYQGIEGQNIADLAWGSSSAKTITLSFLVYSSLTGTFGGTLRNNGSSRTYPFTYTISSANTWTSISLTIPGDTAGTWLTTNGFGIGVYFGLGIGSSYLTTPNVWTSGSTLYPTGMTNVVATNAATWYITGLQFEVGSAATPFEQRPLTIEQQLCYRYCYRWTASATQTYNYITTIRCYSTTNGTGVIKLPVAMRAAPTGTSSTVSSSNWDYGVSAITVSNSWSSDLGTVQCDITGSFIGTGYCAGLGTNGTASAQWMQWTAEL